MAAQARTRSKVQRLPLRLDPWLLGAALALAALGVVMVASSSLALAERAGLGPLYYLNKHLLALALGCVAGAVCLRVPLINLERASPVFMLLSFALLMLVFVPGIGVEVNGSTRWIRTGLLNFQVVEAVKLMLAIYLAGYLVRQAETVRSRFVGSLKPLLVAGLAATLLLAQPDFGGALLVLGLTGAMIWQGGARLRDLGALAVLALPVLVWAVFSESYRMERLKSFLDPWADPYDGGFQLTQALIAIGRGEWFGVGLGGSVQKLFYLPEAHTDFILAVLAEELGLAGVIAVLGLFALLVGRGLVIAMRSLDQGHYFAGYLAFGLSFVIGLQAVVSIGVNFGVLPTKGLTLPLISAGGSSVVVSCLMVGLILRAAHEVGPEGARPAVAVAGRRKARASGRRRVAR